MIIHENLAHLRQEEILAEAERRRLISKAKLHPVRINSYSARSMAWLGSLMHIWGSRLEKRFGKDAVVNHSQSIDRSLKV